MEKINPPRSGKLRGSYKYKIFFHDEENLDACYWLLCSSEKHHEFKYWKILRKFDYIEDILK